MFRNMALGLAGALVLAGSAHAGGLKDGPFVPEPNWAGSYFGVYGGYGNGESSVVSKTTSTSIPWIVNAATAPTPSQAVIDKTQSPSLSPEGYDVGGTFGHNWQAGSLVFGVEGSFGAFHLSDTATNSTPAVTYTATIVNQSAVTSVTTVDTDWLATIRGRLGFSTGRALFYGTGGAAFTSINFHQRNAYSYGGAAAFVNYGSENTSASDTLTGWTAGGGIELKLGGAWSGKLEYLRVDFGNIAATGTVYSPTGVNRATVSHTADLSADIVHVGLNYHFGHQVYEPLK
jgi:outer membrane immunogenic protein